MSIVNVNMIYNTNYKNLPTNIFELSSLLLENSNSIWLNSFSRLEVNNELKFSSNESIN